MNRLIVALIALCPAVWAADPPPVAPAEKIPVIELPPDEKPVGVQKYDPNAVKAREVPYHVAMVKAPEAWAKNPLAKGKGVKVAVVDTGCQADHPGFGGQVKGEYNAITKKEGPGTAADGNGHGTHCCGIVHSIVPEADIYAVKALTDKGSGGVDVLAHGIDYAVSVLKVDVVSCSFGGPQKDSYLPAAIRRAVDAGVVVVCAAGNDGGGPGRDTEGYPGRYDESVSVAACDRNRNLASFSSWGPNVFTTDPGVDVTSLLPGTQEGEMSGTSMACPCEAGKAASWINSNAVPKDKNRSDKFRLIVKGASPFTERNNARGFGLYPLDKITGEATAPPVKPPVPGEKVYTIDLNKLKADGYTGVRIDFGPTGIGSPLPVMKVGQVEPKGEKVEVIGRTGPGVIGPDGLRLPIKPPGKAYPTPDYPDSLSVGDRFVLAGDKQSATLEVVKITPHQAAPAAVPTFTGPGTVFQGYQPAPTVYQQMPACPPGGCRHLLFPRLSGWLR